MALSSRVRSWLLAAVAAAGLSSFALLYRRAFPQAAVSLEVTRGQAVQRARAFLEQRGATLAGFRQAVQFAGDDDGLAFLQRTVGLAEASRWARESVPIWAWQVRWFKPGEKEEWRVRVGVDGRVVGFRHEIEESAPGRTVPQDTALALAQRFLEAQGWQLALLDRVESATEKRERRSDHRFTWERRGAAIAWSGAGAEGKGSVRLEVDVLGDAVGGYRHFLKVPEGFQRSVRRTMSAGQLLSLASLGLTFLLMLTALGMGIARHRRGEVRWGAALRVAAAIAALFLIQGLLSWPAAAFSYPTELGWGTYVGLLMLILFLGSLTYGLWVVFSAGAGEALGREVLPQTLRGWTDLTSGRVRGSDVARASWQGYAVGFALLGYLAVFYLLAQRYGGAWLPAEGPYSEIFNVSLPFLAPLTISLVAAVTEELTYRLFAISLIQRYTGSTLLALFVPAAIWAFGHSSYPVLPVYLRGIELTIAGLAFGWVFLHLGLLACVVAHFVIDAVQIGMPLLTSGNATYVGFGIVVMGFALVPAALSFGAPRRRPPEPSSGAGAQG
jgi:hypothetical protein